VKVFLISAVGQDPLGEGIVRDLEMKGISTHGISCKKDHATATYLCILDEVGNLHTAIADMGILHSIDEQDIQTHKESILASQVTVADGNLSSSCLRSLGLLCEQFKVPLVFEPVSEAKARNAAEADLLKYMNVITPNIGELQVMSEALQRVDTSGVQVIFQATESDKNLTPEAIQECRQRLDSVLPDLLTVMRAMHKEIPEKTENQNANKNIAGKSILLTLGPDGAFLITAIEPYSLKVAFFPAFPAIVENVNGAGDALTSAFTFGIAHGNSQENSVGLGLSVAKQTVESKTTIPIHISVSNQDIQIPGVIVHYILSSTTNS